MAKPRSFDWDEAAFLRSTGWSVKDLAAKYGVTEQGMRYALEPDTRAKMRANHDRWQRGGTCTGCGGSCTRRFDRCYLCAALARATTVREDTLECITCKEWKPDDQFYRASQHIARRQRSRECKACSNARRFWLREKNRVPCKTGCGRTTEGRTGLCATCSRKRVGEMHARRAKEGKGLG